MQLPKDIQNITLKYIYQNYSNFLKWFIDKYYAARDPSILPAPMIDTDINNNKINEILRLNKLKSTFDSKINWNEGDIIDQNIIKQFILFILPLLFNDPSDADSRDYYNYIINDINRKLREYEIPLIIVGSFYGPDDVLRVYEIKDNGVKIL